MTVTYDLATVSYDDAKVSYDGTVLVVDVKIPAGRAHTRPIKPGRAHYE